MISRFLDWWLGPRTFIPRNEATSEFPYLDALPEDTPTRVAIAEALARAETLTGHEKFTELRRIRLEQQRCNALAGVFASLPDTEASDVSQPLDAADNARPQPVLRSAKSSVDRRLR